jgi:branched-chain amino acid transport system substrate-binding protein
MPLGLRILGFCVLGLCAGGCGTQSEPAPVWIGHLSPLSGPEKASGESARRGIRLAVEQANQQPDDEGAGRPVRVLHTDTHGDAEAFAAEATRLVRVNKVAALLGGSKAEEVQEFKRLERTGVCLVSPAGLPADSPSSKNIFFTGMAPACQGQALARFAAEKRFRHVVVLVDVEARPSQNRAVAEAFKEKFLEIVRKQTPARKVAVAGPWPYSKETSLPKRARRIIEEIQNAGPAKKPKPDAILLAGKAAALKQLREELGSQRLPVLFGGEEGSIPELLEEPETNHGIYLATAFVPEAGTDRSKAFVKQFTKRYGEAPDVHAALAYDGARLLFTALRQAKSLERDAVRDALAEIKDFPSLTGPLSFDNQGQAQRPVFIVHIEKGKATKVKRY